MDGIINGALIGFGVGLVATGNGKYGKIWMIFVGGVCLGVYTARMS